MLEPTWNPLVLPDPKGCDRLRFELDLFINMRPFAGVPGSIAEGADFVVIRENTEGTYAGEGGFLRKGTPHEVATSLSFSVWNRSPWRTSGKDYMMKFTICKIVYFDDSHCSGR